LNEIRLEPLSESHLGPLTALIADPEVQRYTLIPVPAPPDFARSWIGGYEQGWRDGTRAGFAIVSAGGEFLGVALAVRIDQEAGTVELGYIVAPEVRGRGVASRALELLTEWAFAELGALRIELRISADNIASSRVAARAGYVREGVLRSTHFKRGMRDDTEIWSRLPTDP
jgi:RimJ/RimL family protein N-acetyltransferase